jgi:Transketolase, C-terminal subunit
MENMAINDKMMRQLLAEVLIDEVKKGSDIVALDADLLNSSGLGEFAKAYPERFFNCGIQEANMIGVAGGLSMTGKIVLAHSFASFAARRVVDQVFMAGIYNRQNIKIVGSDPGILNCANGGTHYALEDTGIMRSMNGISIFDFSDVTMLNSVMPAVIHYPGVSYIRLTRKTKQVIYPKETEFKIGKAHVVKLGRDANIIASGTLMVPEAIKAAGILKQKGFDVGVIDMFTISPIDRDVIIKASAYARILVVAENHNLNCGLCSAVAEVIAEENLSVDFARIAFRENCGEAGTVEYMKVKYGLSAEAIADTILELRNRRSKK